MQEDTGKELEGVEALLLLIELLAISPSVPRFGGVVNLPDLVVVAHPPWADRRAQQTVGQALQPGRVHGVDGDLVVDREAGPMPPGEKQLETALVEQPRPLEEQVRRAGELHVRALGRERSAMRKSWYPDLDRRIETVESR